MVYLYLFYQLYHHWLTSYQRSLLKLFDLHFQRTLLDLELENIKEAIKANALKQRDQLKELGAKYGDGTINPENGEITLLSV